MLKTSSPEIAQKSLQIKEDDKFFSRLLSKENSIANPSFRVYYGGGSVAVPFIWESQPGTPKYSFTQNTLLPPLTPPPSFYSKYNYSKKNKRPNSSINNSRSSNPFSFLISRIKKNMFTFPPSSVEPTSPAASWSSSNQRSRFSSFDSRASDEEGVTIDQSPTYNNNRKRMLCCLVVTRN